MVPFDEIARGTSIQYTCKKVSLNGVAACLLEKAHLSGDFDAFSDNADAQHSRQRNHGAGYGGGFIVVCDPAGA